MRRSRIGKGTLQIIVTQMKGAAGSGGKNPLQGLGSGFNALERELLCRRARPLMVPIAIVDLRSTLCPGQAPMSNLVECTGKIILPLVHQMIIAGPRGRRVQRLDRVTGQTGAEVIIKTCAEKPLDICRAVIRFG